MSDYQANIILQDFDEEKFIEKLHEYVISVISKTKQRLNGFKKCIVDIEYAQFSDDLTLIMVEFDEDIYDELDPEEFIRFANCPGLSIYAFDSAVLDQARVVLLYNGEEKIKYEINNVSDLDDPDEVDSLLKNEIKDYIPDIDELPDMSLAIWVSASERGVDWSSTQSSYKFTKTTANRAQSEDLEEVGFMSLWGGR